MCAKSSKGYTYFSDGFARNVWLERFDNGIAYVRAFAFHSLSVDSALTAYIVVDTCKDVYSVKCNCVFQTLVVRAAILLCCFLLLKRRT